MPTYPILIALGVTLADSFKKKKDFKSDLEYKDYMMKNTEPNMLVLCNKDSSWARNYATINVEEGTVGRVISIGIEGPVVKWKTDTYPRVGSFLNLDLFTTPIKATPVFSHPTPKPMTTSHKK